ncbi:MAG TPA: hypothetical protein VMX11_07590, partial [Actinomycetes bacterium]|nr:hypothetical protein [Actinomycetes bacterium]
SASMTTTTIQKIGPRTMRLMFMARAQAPWTSYNGGDLGLRRYTAAATPAPTDSALGLAFAASDHPPGR